MVLVLALPPSGVDSAVCRLELVTVGSALVNFVPSGKLGGLRAVYLMMVAWVDFDRRLVNTNSPVFLASSERILVQELDNLNLKS